MTREEAVKYEKELKSYVSKVAMNYLPSTRINELVDSCFEIYPNDPVGMELFSLGRKSFSIRPGNVKFHLRDFISACASLALGASTPTTPQELGILIVRILIFLNGITSSFKNTINHDEAYIVAFLHVHNMYERGILEDDFNKEFKSWYFTQTGDRISDSRIKEAIGYLKDELKSIIIIDGEVRLREKVWINKL